MSHKVPGAGNIQNQVLELENPCCVLLINSLRNTGILYFHLEGDMFPESLVTKLDIAYHETAIYD
jgi:hypothetical protein